MNTAILSSTLLLTLLLSVGLFFFIRASIKNRTQQVELASEQGTESLMLQLQQYLQNRSYRLKMTDNQQEEIIFEGFVRPSLFLAAFLTLLAAIGILCLALVGSLLFPNLSALLLWLVIFSPAAGIFYWKKAGRNEQVLLKVENQDKENVQSKVTVIAHRDELRELQRSLQLKPCE